MGDRLYAKHGAFCRLFTGEDLPLRIPSISRPEYLGCTTTALLRHPPAPNTPQGKSHHRPRARSATGITFLRLPTRPLAVAGRPLESASHKRREGRPFRGDPRAPFLVTDLLVRDNLPRVSAGLFSGTGTRNTLQAARPPCPPHRSHGPRRLSRWSAPPGAGNPGPP